MKGFAILAIAFLLAHSGNSAESCNGMLMQSHLLEGLRLPTSDQMPLCHTITNNCCKIEDAIKIYNEVAANVDPMMLSYRDKMQRAIADLVTFNGMVQKLKFDGAATSSQTNFCAKAEQDFKKIVFEPIADALRTGFEKVFSESRDYHLAYYCSICDFKAQSQIDTTKKTITLHPRNCMKRVINNKRYLQALNVDLIRYFQAAQKFLDCVSYDNYFNFPFLYKEQGDNANVAEKCFKKVTNDADSMIAECSQYCSSMNFAGVSASLEGDGSFLDSIVDYYRGLVESTNRRIRQTRVAFKPFQALNTFEIQLTDKSARNLAKTMLVPGRMLAEKAAAGKSGPPGEGASADVINQYYGAYYEELTFEFNAKSKEILKLQTNPYNLKEFKLSFSSDAAALDLTSYFNGLNFDVNKTELTKLTVSNKNAIPPVDPHIEALCALAATDAIKLITDDIKLSAVFTVPPEYISEEEKALAAAPVIEKESAEMVDSEEAKTKLAAEKAAEASAAAAAPAAGGATAAATPAPKPKTRRLRKTAHRRYNKSRRTRASHRRQSRRHASQRMSRNRKLEALYDFGDD